jgi:hypothetical protein
MTLVRMLHMRGPENGRYLVFKFEGHVEPDEAVALAFEQLEEDPAANAGRYTKIEVLFHPEWEDDE